MSALQHSNPIPCQPGDLVQVRRDGGPLAGRIVRLRALVAPDTWLAHDPDEPAHDGFVRLGRIVGHSDDEAPARARTERRIALHVPARPAAPEPMPRKALPRPAWLVEAETQPTTREEPVMSDANPAPGAEQLVGLDPVAIGELLADAIERNGWTQRQAATHFGLSSQSRVSHYVRLARRASEAFPAQADAEHEAALAAAVLDEDDARDELHDAQALALDVAYSAALAELGARGWAEADRADLLAEVEALAEELAGAGDELAVSRARGVALVRVIRALRDKLSEREEAQRRLSCFCEDLEETARQLRATIEELVESRDALEIERDALRDQVQQAPAPLVISGNGHDSATVQALRQELATLAEDRDNLARLLARLERSSQQPQQVFNLEAGAQVVIQWGR